MDDRTSPPAIIIVNEDLSLRPFLGTENVLRFFLALPTVVDLPDRWRRVFRRSLTPEEMQWITESPPPRALASVITVIQLDGEETIAPDSGIELASRAMRVMLDIPPAAPLDFTDTHYHSCMEVLVQAPIPLTDESLTSSFEAGLDYARQVQVAAFSENHRYSQAVTIETLPLVVPYVVHEFNATPDAASTDRRLLTLPTVAKINDLSPPDVRHGGIRAATALDLNERTHGLNVDFALTRLSREQMERGDYQAAFLTAAIACESLLDITLSGLLWEEGLTPESAGKIFALPLVRRVIGYLPARLGDDWVYRSGSISHYWREVVVHRRNRIVHRATTPSRSEALAAIEASDELGRYFASMATGEVFAQRYPRVASMLVDVERMEPDARALVVGLAIDSPPIRWVETFDRWRQSTEVLAGVRRLGRRGRLGPSSVGRLEVAAVARPGGILRFATWDLPGFVAAEVGPPGELDKQGHDNLSRIAAECEIPLLVGLVGVEREPLDSDQWVLDYHLIPNRGVMVHGADLDPA
jgi:hypothetical protein